MYISARQIYGMLCRNFKSLFGEHDPDYVELISFGVDVLRIRREEDMRKVLQYINS